MAQTAAEIRELLRLGSIHPADRPAAMAEKVRKSLEPVLKKQAMEAAKVVGAAQRENEKLQRTIAELEAKVAQTNLAVTARQRMTPQDLRDALNGLFDTYDFSPAEELVQMLMNREHPHYIADTKTRVGVLETLNSYVMPKLKSTEIKGKVDHSHTIKIVRYGEDVEIPAREAVPIEATVVEQKTLSSGGTGG